MFSSQNKNSKISQNQNKFSGNGRNLKISCINEDDGGNSRRFRRVYEEKDDEIKGNPRVGGFRDLRELLNSRKKVSSEPKVIKSDINSTKEIKSDKFQEEIIKNDKEIAPKADEKPQRVRKPIRMRNPQSCLADLVRLQVVSAINKNQKQETSSNSSAPSNSRESLIEISSTSAHSSKTDLSSSTESLKVKPKLEDFITKTENLAESKVSWVDMIDSDYEDDDDEVFASESDKNREKVEINEQIVEKSLKVDEKMSQNDKIELLNEQSSIKTLRHEEIEAKNESLTTKVHNIDQKSSKNEQIEKLNPQNRNFSDHSSDNHKSQPKNSNLETKNTENVKTNQQTQSIAEKITKNANFPHKINKVDQKIDQKINKIEVKITTNDNFQIQSENSQMKIQQNNKFEKIEVKITKNEPQLQKISSHQPQTTFNNNPISSVTQFTEFYPKNYSKIQFEKPAPPVHFFPPQNHGSFHQFSSQNQFYQPQVMDYQQNYQFYAPNPQVSPTLSIQSDSTNVSVTSTVSGSSKLEARLKKIRGNDEKLNNLREINRNASQNHQIYSQNQISNGFCGNLQNQTLNFQNFSQSYQNIHEFSQSSQNYAQNLSNSQNFTQSSQNLTQNHQIYHQNNFPTQSSEISQQNAQKVQSNLPQILQFHQTKAKSCENLQKNQISPDNVTEINKFHEISHHSMNLSPLIEASEKITQKSDENLTHDQMVNLIYVTKAAPKYLDEAMSYFMEYYSEIGVDLNQKEIDKVLTMRGVELDSKNKNNFGVFA